MSSEFLEYSEDVKLTSEQLNKSHSEWHGITLYISRTTREERDARNEEIRRLYYECHFRLNDLVRRTGLSDRQIRRIVQEK